MMQIQANIAPIELSLLYNRSILSSRKLERDQSLAPILLPLSSTLEQAGQVAPDELAAILARQMLLDERARRRASLTSTDPAWGAAAAMGATSRAGARLGPTRHKGLSIRCVRVAESRVCGASANCVRDSRRTGAAALAGR